jgi:hypothetical protein
VTSPAEHAATVRVNLHVHETPCDPGTCHVCRSGEALDALVALAARADEPSATFIPRETDEKPSDAMPSPGHKDWRETAEWWESTCKYWKARADELERERDEAIAAMHPHTAVVFLKAQRMEADLRDANEKLERAYRYRESQEGLPDGTLGYPTRAALGEQPHRGSCRIHYAEETCTCGVQP